MGSIPPTPSKTQEQHKGLSPHHPSGEEQHVSQFRYAFRLTPERVKTLSPQQREEALLEFITLFSLIVSIIYNPAAREATRLLALDVILTQVQRSARKLIAAVTDKSPTFAPETEKRLGLSKNTISSGYKTLEKAGVLERSHRTDELTKQDHLDIAPTPALFTSPDVIRDKKKRAAPKPKLIVKPVDPARECLDCGSHNLRITCRKCGSFINLGEVEHVCQQPAEQELHQDTNTSHCHPITHFVTAIQNEVLESPRTAPQGACSSTKEQNSEEELMHEALQPATDQATHHKICDDSNTPRNGPHLGMASQQEGEGFPITAPQAPEEIITTWLAQRIGEGQMIYATGKTEQNEKYLSFPPGYRPDIAAYLAGNLHHIYGSRLATSTHTSVLGFDIDKPEQDARKEVYLQQLRNAGAFPLYWHRQNNRGHLEVYFSKPVHAETAYQWCLSVCPELADIPECYPVKDKKSNGFSWPLFQRVGKHVYECPVSYWARRGLETISGVQTDPYAVEILIEKAVTPAPLIHVLPQGQTDHPPDGLEPPEGDGGVLLEKIQEFRPGKEKHDQAQDLQTAKLETSDLAKVIAAEFDACHTWEEVTATCGGIRNNRFCAVWRGEKHASVVIDPDGYYACDYGRIGTHYLKKLDKYEVWCLAQGIDKTRDLAERIAAYRKSQRAKDEEPFNNPPMTNAASHEYQPTPASELALRMVNYQVMYLPNVPCTCGCELWRPVLGTYECCRCSPSPLWPDKYDQALRELYPKP